MRRWQRRISVIAIVCLVKSLLCLAITDYIGVETPPDNGDMLFPKGKAIGQPQSSLNPQIRMLRVDSHHDALVFFKAYCNDSCFVVKKVDGRNCLGYRAKNGDLIIFADSTAIERREVATMYFKSDRINALGIERIIFVETIKRNKNKADSEKPEKE